MSTLENTPGMETEQPGLDRRIGHIAVITWAHTHAAGFQAEESVVPAHARAHPAIPLHAGMVETLDTAGESIPVVTMRNFYDANAGTEHNYAATVWRNLGKRLSPYLSSASGFSLMAEEANYYGDFVSTPSHGMNHIYAVHFAEFVAKVHTIYPQQTGQIRGFGPKGLALLSEFTLQLYAPLVKQLPKG